MQVRAMLATLALMLLPLGAWAGDEASKGSESEPASDFLEFLGTWETSDGQWVDPAELEERWAGESNERYGSKSDE